VKANAIRTSFLDFFSSRGHAQVASAPLIPQNDPTLFFVNAGMVPFKDLFTGAETRDYTRATSAQRCLRVSGKHNDLDNVGRTPRHHTFFEMLGNFSFGDYFKDDAIPMAWELLREVYGIPEERLWVTVFEDDDEAYDVWRRTGVAADRIQRLGEKDNFWSMGPTGPCGPCTEIFFDHGPAHGPGGGPAANDHRYIEIWNLVLMQYEQHADGSRTSLPKPSIDTGSGLERVAAALQGHFSNYDTDLFQPLIQRAAKAADVRYGASDDTDTALRVIADHARATTFLIADGVMPSNVGRGYILRRIMRRAIRFGVKIGMDAPFMHDVVDEVVRGMADVHTHLHSRHAFLEEVVRGEEERFRRTLSRGLKLLDAEIERVGARGTIPGDIAFQLSDTYGFPLDLTEQIAQERDVHVDKPGFDEALEAQKERGRSAWKGSGQQAVDGLWQEIASEAGDTVFVGYDADVGSATVAALVKREGKGDDVTYERVERLESGDEGAVIVDRTTLYGEGGGQVGDSGSIGGFAVRDTQRAAGLFVHHGEAEHPIAVGDDVTTRADGTRRNPTKRNHTATHLLHAALRDHLGTHVTQKGSLVGPNRLRFDFSHHKPMTTEEIQAVEDLVNAEILKNTPLTDGVHTMDEAKALGAMALFGEKYGDRVRVVSVPGFSVELCGGTHVAATGDIGPFRILSESGIAAGVRRIEASTGANALRVFREEQALICTVAQRLKTSPDQLVAQVDKLAEDKKAVERELATLKAQLAAAAAGDLLSDAVEIAGVKVVTTIFDGDLKDQADRLRDQLGSGIVVLGKDGGKSAQLVAAVTKDLAGKRAHAGNIIKAIAPVIGGKGGGRPDMAQGGGKDASQLQAALDEAREVIAEQLG
jgi:alanyl-tRNA synthetase